MVYPYFHWWLVVLTLLAIAGFYPGYLTTLSALPWTQHYHSITTLIFFLLLICQQRLAQHHQLRWHRAIGRLSLIFATLFLHSGMLSLHALLTSSSPVLRQLASEFSMSECFLLLGFAMLYYLAIRTHHHPKLHERCWVALSLLFITPVLSRVVSFWLPGLIISSLAQYRINVYLTFAIPIVISAGLLWYDRRHGQPGTVYLMVLMILVSQFAVSSLAGPHSVWSGISQTFASMPPTIVALVALLPAMLPATAGFFWLYRRR